MSICDQKYLFDTNIFFGVIPEGNPTSTSKYFCLFVFLLPEMSCHFLDNFVVAIILPESHKSI